MIDILKTEKQEHDRLADLFFLIVEKIEEFKVSHHPLYVKPSKVLLSKEDFFIMTKWVKIEPLEYADCLITYHSDDETEITVKGETIS